MRALSENAESLLPGDSFKIDRDSSGNPVTKTVTTTTDFVTDNAADTINPSSPVRRSQRAKGSAPPRRQRAAGKRSGSSPFARARRPSRNPAPPVAVRDRVTGKWQKTKAANHSPPPE